MDHASPRVATTPIRTPDGVGLFHRDWGDGPPVVFVASWSLPSDSWAYQMLALSEAGCRCVAYDRRGHGRSDDPGRGFDFERWPAISRRYWKRLTCAAQRSSGSRWAPPRSCAT